MDTGSLVKTRIAAGRYVLEKLAAAGFDVTAAAWVKTAEKEWKLYLVSKRVNEQGRPAAYGEARKVLDQVPDAIVSLDDVMLIPTDSPSPSAFSISGINRTDEPRSTWKRPNSAKSPPWRPSCTRRSLQPRRTRPLPPRK